MVQSRWKEEILGRLDWSLDKLDEVMQGFAEVVSKRLAAGERIYIDGLGLFTTRKQNERILTNADTKERHLVPPTIEVLFASLVEDVEMYGENSSLLQSIAKAADITELSDIENFIHHLPKVIKEYLSSGEEIEWPEVGTFSPVLDSNEEGEPVTYINFVATGLMQETVNKPFSHFQSVLLDEGVTLEGVDEVIIDRKIPEKENKPVESKIKKTIAIAAEELEPEETSITEPEPIIEDIDRQPTFIEAGDKKQGKLQRLKRAIEKHPVLAPIIGGVVIALGAVLFSFRRQK